MGFVLMKPILQLSDEEPQPKSERDKWQFKAIQGLMVVMRHEPELRDAEPIVHSDRWKASTSDFTQSLAFKSIQMLHI